jgi:hypothetical protein
MGWKEVLLPYRAMDNFQGAAILAQSSTLMRLAAAWPQVKRQTPDPPPPSHEIDLEDLWKKTVVDFEGWAKLAQLDPLLVMEGFPVLQGNGIIMPDGTLNHLAESLLQKEAAGSLMAQFGIKPGDRQK